MRTMHLSEPDLQAHLTRQDMIWTKLPMFWDEGPFLGNGCTGAMVFVDAKSGRLHIKPGRADIYDNRPLEWFSVMDKQFAQPRLQLGPMEIATRGTLTGCDLRLDLYNATLTGKLITSCGTVEMTLWVPRTEEALVVDLRPDENEIATLIYLPLPAESPRQTRMHLFGDEKRARADYAPPREALPDRKEGDVLIHEQPLFTSGSYSICERKRGTVTHIAVAVSDEDGAAVRDALATLGRMEDGQTLRSKHEEAWHEIFSRSFLSVSDPVWENFYWVQIYKMASAARPGGRIIDTMGPWCFLTSWPAAFWNLNVQLTYAPMIPTGLFDIARSLPDTLSRERDNLRQNVAPAYREGSYGIGTNTCRSLRSELAIPGPKTDSTFKVELGNLSWALFVCYTLCRTTLDERMLTDTVLPLLAGAVNYYMHFLTPDEAGVLHLAPTESPEYLVVDEDTNYDLALLSWGLQTLIREHERLGDGDSRLPKWKDTLAHLVPFPEDPEEGLLIAGHTHLSTSHRHYSHLLSFYPLHLLDAKKASDCDRIRRSVAHWHSMPEQLEGYSQTGAASMLAMMGDGNGALGYLNGLLSKFVRPTTMYREGGGPVLETPLAAVSAMTDMLLQSYGGELNVFPACPSKWRNASFTLFGEGGYMVSAGRKNGRVQFVRVMATADGEVALRVAFDRAPTCDRPFVVKDGVYHFRLKRGESACLRICQEADAAVFPVAAEEQNIFGLNERTYGYVAPVASCEISGSDAKHITVAYPSV